MTDIVDRLRNVAHTHDEYGVHSEIELEAAKEIERLRKNFVTAEHEMKVADQNRIFFQKEYERWMSIAQEMNAYSVKLEEAIYNYVSTVVGYEGVTFIDGVHDEWAKLICDVWKEQHKKMGEKE
jgi:hypothetical protein